MSSSRARAMKDPDPTALALAIGQLQDGPSRQFRQQTGTLATGPEPQVDVAFVAGGVRVPEDGLGLLVAADQGGGHGRVVHPLPGPEPLVERVGVGPGTGDRP